MLAEKIVEMELCIQSHRDEREQGQPSREIRGVPCGWNKHLGRSGNFLGEREAGARLARGFKPLKELEQTLTATGNALRI